jgi:hypothetical protein
MKDQKPSNQKATTPEFRVSFPAIFEPKLNTLSNKEEYSIQMIFDKTADLSQLKKMAKDCVVAKWGSKIPEKLRSPFRDGDEYNDTAENQRAELEGKIFINAKSKQRPGLVDGSLQPILDPSEFYGGCYARATVRAYAYDQKGNRGVAFGLLNVQKLRDGEPFSGKMKAEDDFSPITPEEVDSKAENAADIFA